MEKVVFPALKKSQEKQLAASGDDISILVTWILDKNIERPFLFLSASLAKNNGTTIIRREPHYQDIFSPKTRKTYL